MRRERLKLREEVNKVYLKVYFLGRKCDLFGTEFCVIADFGFQIAKLGTRPEGGSPQDKFAIISLCSMLYFNAKKVSDEKG